MRAAKSGATQSRRAFKLQCAARAPDDVAPPLRLYGDEEGRRRRRAQPHSPSSEGGAAPQRRASRAAGARLRVRRPRRGVDAPFAEIHRKSPTASLNSTQASTPPNGATPETGLRRHERIHQEYAHRRRPVADLHRRLGLFLRIPGAGQAAADGGRAAAPSNAKARRAGEAPPRPRRVEAQPSRENARRRLWRRARASRSTRPRSPARSR